jgi:basic amino acid/polyamine antiporter, APA family
MVATKTKDGQLQRELGVFGATMMGLGSIVGTGVFVSIAIAAEAAGPAVIVAVALGAMVAIFNGLNSAQLAANHPVSGGTYEYGYEYLNPWLGFIAGWMFLLAKSASAATAALGFSGYLLNAFGVESTAFVIPLAVGAVVAITVLTVGGLRRSNVVNVTIVSITLGTLGFFVLSGLPTMAANVGENVTDFFDEGIAGLLNAAALMFVAYTGYGRIATLGEEVREPRRTIPRAIITTLVSTMVMYMAVAVVAVGSVGAAFLSGTVVGTAAPLEIVAQTFSTPGVGLVMAVGAVTAMLGVLLNLVLGLSRVLLAMGRREDMPRVVARVDDAGKTPYVAVLVMGTFVGLLVLLGDVRTTWSFSAVTVLLYYSITNLSALQLTAEQRLFPRWLAFAGLGACFFLTFWVSWQIYAWVAVLIIVGLGWKVAMNRVQGGVAE